MTSDEAEFVYKCTDYYNPEFEKSILWNDKTLSINWPTLSEPLLSIKDARGENFSQETYL